MQVTPQGACGQALAQLRDACRGNFTSEDDYGSFRKGIQWGEVQQVEGR